MLYCGDEETLFGQVHNCLIPYEELKKKEETASTIHYDLSNVIEYNEYKL